MDTTERVDTRDRVVTIWAGDFDITAAAAAKVGSFVNATERMARWGRLSYDALVYML